MRLGYRPPYDVAAMLGFFGQRAIRGVELVSHVGTGGRAGPDAAPSNAAGSVHAGWLAGRASMQARRQVVLRVSDSLREVLPLVIRRVRAALDLDADPRGHQQPCCTRRFPGGDGLRVPGALNGYELAVRAVLGQQITVAAARTLAQRLVDRFGEPIETPWPELTRLFPAPAVLARASGDALGQLGIVQQRQAAIVAIAQRRGGEALQLHGGADVQRHHRRRSRHCPASATGRRSTSPCARCAGPTPFRPATSRCTRRWACRTSHARREAALAASQAWQPWRSYAVIRAWNGLAAPTSPRRCHRAAPSDHTIAARPRPAPPTAQGDHMKFNRIASCSDAIDSPLGPMIVAATRRGLAGALVRRPAPPARSLGWPRTGPTIRCCGRRMRQLDDVLRRPAPAFDLPLDLACGTAFQQSVWQALLAIPRGATDQLRRR